MSLKVSEIASVKNVMFPFLEEPVVEYTLLNGHKIIVVNKKSELINISTWVKTGSIHENDEITGISHFLEHLMFKGTTKYPAGEFDKMLESNGGIVNAATWKDYTFYYVTLPKGQDNKNFHMVLDLHADMMIDAVIPENEIGPAFEINKLDEVESKRERCVVIEEIGMRNDQPWTKVYNAVNKLMYNTHPYKRDVIGTKEVIATIPRDKIADYYKNWYTPENMTTILVGDFEAEDVIDKIRARFLFDEDIECEYPEFDQEPHQQEQRYVEDKGEIDTGFIIMGYHGPRAKELKESILLDVISIILGEGKSSYLYKNLIQKPESPIFNIIGSGQYQFRDGNTFFVQGNFKPEYKEEAKNRILEQVNSLIDNGVSEDELKKAKKNLKIRFAEEAETVSEIGETIGYYMTVCESLEAYADYLKILEELTVQDVKDCAAKYLTDNKASISVLCPKGNEE